MAEIGDRMSAQLDATLTQHTTTTTAFGHIEPLSG